MSIFWSNACSLFLPRLICQGSEWRTQCCFHIEFGFFLKAFGCSIKHISNQNLLMEFYFLKKCSKKRRAKNTKWAFSFSSPCCVAFYFEGFNLLSMVAFEILFSTFWLIQKFCNCQKNYYLNIQFQGMRCQVSTRISKYSNLYRTYT